MTLLTVLLAWPDPPATLAVLVRPAYFALLSWFFWRTSRVNVALHSQAMRLVTGGFLVLWLGYTLSAAIHFSGLEADFEAASYLRNTCERGAWFLLGTTLIAYGLMMWIPHVVRSHHLLAAHSARQEGELQRAQSARTELERRLVDADRLGMLGELAASIAHDLRNPLTVVKGTAESLCRKPRTAEEVAEHTDVIRRNIDKADRTIESLIDLARPKAHQQSELDVHTTLTEIQDLLTVEARRRGVQLLVARNADRAGRLPTDRTLLAQALMNLVLNSLQASPRGTAVHLDARPFGDRVAVTVYDRGSGIADVRAELFQPFFTTKQNGTGLGLASCRRIARELGGDLRLYPRLRGGTRAILWLPRAKPLATATSSVDSNERCPAAGISC